jgi:hypothetical protein
MPQVHAINPKRMMMDAANRAKLPSRFFCDVSGYVPSRNPISPYRMILTPKNKDVQAAPRKIAATLKGCTAGLDSLANCSQ